MKFRRLKMRFEINIIFYICREYYSGNSFSGVPRALHGVPEGNGMENTESNAAANILNPTNLNKLLNLADRVQRNYPALFPLLRYSHIRYLYSCDRSRYWS